MPRKRESLVCEYLERVHVNEFKENPAILKMIVNGHGVYALYRKRKLYYVGLASKLRGRIGTHIRDRHSGKWDNFSTYATISNRHMKELESLLIRIVKPGGNSQGGKFANATNLKKTYKRHLRHEYLAKVARLMGKEPPEVRLPRSVRRGKEKGNRFAGAVDRTRTIKRLYKGETVKARLRPDGQVTWRGKRYESPTIAASKIGGRRINGWYFWKIERAPGQWVSLRKIKPR